MYVWQMNDGRWHVSHKTSIKYNAAMAEFDGGYETRAEAETALREWRARHPDAEQPAFQKWHF